MLLAIRVKPYKKHCLRKTFKSRYDPKQNRVTVLTVQSSKGLEFQRVLLVGIDKMQLEDDQEKNKLLYVGMTRAQRYLQVSASSDCALTRRLAQLLL